MKTKYKYFILIIITILASIGIYEYVEANTEVTWEGDLAGNQSTIDEEIQNDTNYSLEKAKVILNPYEISPLTALIVFETSDLSSVTVTVKGKDGDEDITNTFVPAKTHYISVYGLYPDYENTVIIEVSGESKEFKITTDPLPDEIENAESINAEDGFYFTTSADDGYPVAYDENGIVRWYLTTHCGFDFTRLSNGYVLLGSETLMNSPYYSSSLLEMDLLGKVYYEYRLPGGYHHDVYEMESGNLLVLSNDFDSGTIEDVIVEIDRNTGEVVKEINLYDLLPNDDGEDWISLNSVIYDDETNSILVAGSKQDMIINIDYTTEEINWIIGSDEYALEGDIELPSSPSGLVLTDDGFAFISTKDGNNYLIEYKVNTSDRKVEEVTNIDLESKCTNTNLEYSDGTFIVTLDDTIKTIKDDKVTTTLKTNYNLYSTKKTSMYEGDIFMLNTSSKLGSTGITSTTNNHTIFFYKVDDSIFEKYDLTLVQNSDRLIVKGTFDKDDSVQIILDNVLTKTTYDIDIASGEETEEGMYTETYISKEEIYGKHYIYLRINGTIYKLEKYITS